MANPTGSVYLQANASYVWANGDVYEIQQTDTIEGAATGASFSGIGVDNQPHQLLLDKINYLHAKQLTEEATIASLASVAEMIQSDIGTSGWVSFGVKDVNLGRISILIQWGVANLYITADASLASNANIAGVPVTFPTPFPNAVWMINPYMLGNCSFDSTNVDPDSYSLDIMTILPSGSPPFTGVTFAPLMPGEAVVHGVAVANGLTQLGWIAVGY
jgi:hypothetical protein